MELLNELVTVTYTLEGIAPMLMHSSACANPLNPLTIAMSEFSTKRAKTLEDHRILADFEMWAGLYLDSEVFIDGEKCSVDPKTKIILPSHVVDSVIREGARKNKLGKAAAAGVLVEGDAEFMHTGPKDVNELVMHPQHRAQHIVNVGGKRITRTRPMFNEWTARFQVVIDPEVVNPDHVERALHIAGRLVGIGDWRPGAPRGGGWGRFQLVRAEFA